MITHFPVLFSSGKNVSGRKIERIRTIIENKDDEEIYNIDFRHESEKEPRMKALCAAHQKILDKMRDNLNEVTPISVGGTTGTFVVLNNKRVLHARAPFKSEQAAKNMSAKDRLLFRSKGQKTRPYRLEVA